LTAQTASMSQVYLAASPPTGQLLISLGSSHRSKHTNLVAPKKHNLAFLN